MFLTPLVLGRVFAFKMKDIDREAYVSEVGIVSNHVQQRAVVVVENMVGLDGFITKGMFDHLLNTSVL
jgi:hypothetical protein